MKTLKKEAFFVSRKFRGFSRKSGLLIVASIFSIIFLSSFVMALTEFPAPRLPLPASPFDFLGELLKGIFKAVVESANVVLNGANIGEIAFSKLLLAILLFAIIYSVTSKIPTIKDSNFARITVSIIVPILGMQVLTDDIIRATLLPYNAITIAIATFIPLIIYAYFLDSIDFSLMRKIGWVLATCVFLGIWSTRPLAVQQVAGNIYGFAAIISVLLLLFDGTIHYWILRARLKRGEEVGMTDQITYAFSELLAAQEAFRRSPKDANTKKLLERKTEAFERVTKKMKK